MNVFMQELLGGLPNGTEWVRVLIRIGGALLAGGIIGMQREQIAKSAGFRTHMLVALGATLFVLVPEQIGMTSADLSRIIQGIATGIGFLGAGVILKLEEKRQIKGLTTAAGVWTTAAIGVVIGLGGLGIGLLCTVLVWIVLSVLHHVERGMPESRE